MLHPRPPPAHPWAQGSCPSDSPTHHSLVAHLRPSCEDPLSHPGGCPGPGRPPEMTCIWTQLRSPMLHVESGGVTAPPWVPGGSWTGQHSGCQIVAPWCQSADPSSLLAWGLSFHTPALTQEVWCTPLETPCACPLPSGDLWSGAHGGLHAAGWVNTRRPRPRHLPSPRPAPSPLSMRKRTPRRG